MNNIAKDFWSSEKAAKVFEIANAEQKKIQPQIAKVIEDINPKTLLDYGCGDSFISRLLNNKIEISLYDLNVQESQKALNHLEGRNAIRYESPEDIPADYFDCIVFSLVLICLSSKEEYRSILSNFKKYKNKDGKYILVTTHPCFRQYDYRPFYTDYTTGKPFNYFNALEPFEVYIRDNDQDGVHFTDFHWTLADTINETINSGFTLEKIIEVPDSTFDKMPANPYFSPFMILIFS